MQHNNNKQLGDSQLNEKDQVKPHTFGFAAAIGILKNGGKVKREVWSDDNYLSVKENKLAFYFSKHDAIINMFHLANEDLLAEDWIVYSKHL